MKIVVDNQHSAGRHLCTAKLGALHMALKQNFTGGNRWPRSRTRCCIIAGDVATPGPVPYTGPVIRRLTLNEDFDDYGRLIQMEGTFDVRMAPITRVCPRGAGVILMLPRRLQRSGPPKYGRSSTSPGTPTQSISTWSMFSSSSGSRLLETPEFMNLLWDRQLRPIPTSWAGRKPCG